MYSTVLPAVTVALLLLMAVSYTMVPYFLVLGIAAHHCYSRPVPPVRKVISMSLVAVTWFYIIRFMANHTGLLNAFDAAYADVIWGGTSGNWAYTQTLLCWAVVATVWSADASIFFTLFGVLGCMSSSYLLYSPPVLPQRRVSVAYAIFSCISFISIGMLPMTESAWGLGWWLWILHVCLIAPKLLVPVLPKMEVERGSLYVALASASLLVHLSSGKGSAPTTDCRISITVDAVACACITMAFIFDRSKSLTSTCFWGLMLPLLSPGFVLAAFCALEQNVWARLVTKIQHYAAEQCRARTGAGDEEGKWQQGSWTNLGFWKDTKHYDTACRGLARQVGAAADLGATRRLLCVACGAGDELQYFKEKFDLQYATGLDPEPISTARSCEFALQGLRVVQGEAEDMARGSQHFCPGEFDRIVAVDSIYHVEKASFYADCKQLLSQGGVVAVSDVLVKPDAPWWVQRLLCAMGIRLTNQWCQAEYEERLASLGFSQVKVASLEPFVLSQWLPELLRRHLDYAVVSAALAPAPARPKAAVVGSGLSGLVAARLLATSHEVTVFEARPEPGFAGMEAKLPSGGVVDIPMRMIEFNYWRRLVALCRKLGVPLVSTNFTVSMFGDSNQKLVNTDRQMQVANIANNLKWYLTLAWSALQLGLRAADPGEALGHFAHRLGLANCDFYVAVRRHFSWILSCTYEMVDGYPLELVSEFYMAIAANFWVSENPTVRIFPSVRRLQETLLVGREVRAGRPVPPFELGKPKEVDGEAFDVVVIATEANAVSKVLPRNWTSVFAEFQYHPSHVFVHRDASLMPGQREQWRAVNVCDDAEGAACQITVWVNAYYEGVDLGGDVFETVNPRHRPKDELIIRECHLQRVVHTKESAVLQAKIAELQGREGFYFCGAYSVPGLGLLEQALHSAELAVEAVRRDLEAAAQ